VSLPQLLPLFAQTGVLGVFAWVLYRFFRSAVDAHAKTAEAWQKAWAAEVERSNVRDAQVQHILDAVRSKAGTAPTVKEGT
jgi:hypothetical protein